MHTNAHINQFGRKFNHDIKIIRITKIVHALQRNRPRAHLVVVPKPRIDFCTILFRYTTHLKL